MATFNPLHKYRNYVPHYALVAIPDSAAASQFFEPEANTTTGMNLYLHPSGGRTTKYDAQGQNQDYVVIFNSTTDAEFYIDKLELSTILQPQGAHVGDGYDIHSVGLHMSMKVIEPYTIDFVTILHEASLKLGMSSMALMQYLIKIFFVGYKEDDTVDIISFVEPIVFAVLQIDLTLTHAGTEYNIMCQPESNAGNDIKMNNIGGVTFQTVSTLSGTIDKLNEKLQERADLANLNVNISNPSIKYKVLLDEAYKDPKYKLDNITSNQQNNYDGVGDPQNIQFITGTADTLPQTITNIMISSKAVVNESKANPPPAPGAIANTYVHKIHTRSVKVGNTVTYYYYILRHVARVMGAQVVSEDLTDTDSKITSLESASNQQSRSSSLPLLSAAEGTSSGLEYDYIYTGKNVDITQYIMTIPMIGNGTPFLLYMPNSPVTSVDSTKFVENQQDPKKVNQNPKTNQNDAAAAAGYNTVPTSGRTDAKTVVPLVTSDNMKAGMGAADSALFFEGRQILSRFITENNITAALEIVGNPILLQTIMQPLYVFFDGQESRDMKEVKKNLELRQELGGLGGGALNMNIVKINIRVPKPIYLQGDIFSGSSDVEYENKFSTKFWNNNCYTITAIDHIFEKNRFTQRMKLILYPSHDSGSVTIHDASPGGKTANADTSTAGVNNPKPAPPVLPATLSKCDTIAVRKKIYNKLIEHGLSSVHAAGIVGNIYAESKFDPNIHQIGGGGGYGLIQWTDPHRKNALLAAAKKKGVDVSDLDFQVDYIVQELHGPESSAYRKLLQTTTPEDAAYAYAMFGERPYGTHIDKHGVGTLVHGAAGAKSLNMAGRQAAARDAYDNAVKPC